MTIINYLLWAMAHIGVWALMLLCAAGVGSLALRKCRFNNLAERAALVLGAGLGLCAILLFILGLAGLLYRPVIWVLTVLGAAATVLVFLRSKKSSLGINQLRQRLSLRQMKLLYSPRNAVIALLIVLSLGYWFVLLMTAQYPPVHWDSISHHLIIAREFLAEHRPVVVPGIQQPIMPALNHMLFTWAFALQDDILAQIVEHTFLMLTAVGLYGWGKRQDRPALGFAAATLWVAHPLVRLLGNTAYVDIALTGFAFLGVYALRLFWDDRNTMWWYLAIALLAMGAGVKLPGLFFVGVASMLGLWALASSYLKSFRRRPAGEAPEEGAEPQARFTWKSLVLGWSLGLLVLIPWYGFVAYHTGNPFWPTFAQYSTGIWGAPWIVSGVDQLLSGSRNATVENFLLLSLDFLRYPARFNAELHQSLFPLIVIWPLAWIVSLFNRSVRWWTLWAVGFTIFWFLQAPLLRYWLPALPMAGLALCESIQWILDRIRKRAAFHNVAWVAIGVIILLLSGRELYGVIKGNGLPPVTPETREAFLSQLIGYRGVKYVNEHADKNDTVCVLSASWLNYFFDQKVLDLRGTLFQNRKPSFRWPNDQLWVQWLDFQGVKWIFINFKAHELNMPKQNPVVEPFWPDYDLVYADQTAWVFRRKPVAPAISLNRNDTPP